jgi:hypothetical protein
MQNGYIESFKGKSGRVSERAMVISVLIAGVCVSRQLPSCALELPGRKHDSQDRSCRGSPGLTRIAAGVRIEGGQQVGGAGLAEQAKQCGLRHVNQDPLAVAGAASHAKFGAVAAILVVHRTTRLVQLAAACR